MVWLVPAALAGLTAIAGPVVLHLLRRRTARRLVVPSTRFVVGRTNSAVRIGRISDPLLLLVRALVLASAAVALAQPLWLTGSRAERWAQQIARAIVVDTSSSAGGTNTGEAVAAERSSADHVITIDDIDPGSALTRAARWLDSAPPARREIVVVSDFQRGALTEADVSRVPASVGLRFVATSAASATREAPLVRTLVPGGSVTAQPAFDAGRTTVRYSSSGSSTDGLRIVADPGDSEDVAALMRVVSNAGAAAPDPSEPIVIRFPGGEALPPVRSTAGGWSFGAAQRLLRSPGLDAEALAVASTADALVVNVAAEPASLLAAQVVKAALDARIDPATLRELEPERIPAEALAAWSREPVAPDADAWRQTDESDGCWFWALALLLLGAETIMRRSPAKEVQATEAHAA